LKNHPGGRCFSDTINTGIYLLEPSVSRISRRPQFLISPRTFSSALRREGAALGHIAEGYWKDVGDLLEYRLAHADILEKLINIPFPGP